MLHDFTGAVASEDIYCRIVIASRPVLTAVNDNKVALGDSAFYIDVFAGKLACHSFEISNKPCPAAFDMRIMLNVIITDITLHSSARLAIIEHQLVESDDVRLVLFNTDSGISSSRSGPYD